MSLNTAFGKLNGAVFIIQGEETLAFHSTTFPEEGKQQVTEGISDVQAENANA